jgi:hypothetical protein
MAYEAATEAERASDDRIRRINTRSFRRSNSCCQIRSTRQPRERNDLFASRSRTLFCVSFFFQKLRLLLGIPPCFEQRCQKQPSTKTTSRLSRKMKSGFPGNREFLRHPLIFAARKTSIARSSVDRLRLARTLDIILLRSSRV